MAKNMVMVVDDEKGYADEIAGVLKDNEYDTVIAYSAIDALKEIKKNQKFLGLSNKSKLVLLDTKMPEIDGLQFLEKLCSEYIDKQIIL